MLSARILEHPGQTLAEAASELRRGDDWSDRVNFRDFFADVVRGGV
jgi:hypothetical protein